MNPILLVLSDTLWYRLKMSSLYLEVHLFLDAGHKSNSPGAFQLSVESTYKTVFTVSPTYFWVLYNYMNPILLVLSDSLWYLLKNVIFITSGSPTYF
jgi:hypothetical protein